MKVRAKLKGYYNHRRIKEGMEFELLNEKDYSSIWMEKIEEPVSRKEPEVEKPKKRHEVEREVI